MVFSRRARRVVICRLAKKKKASASRGRVVRATLPRAVALRFFAAGMPPQGCYYKRVAIGKAVKGREQSHREMMKQKHRIIKTGRRFVLVALRRRCYSKKKEPVKSIFLLKVV
jgi:hypothetical protein